jgi:hypothetical protein
MDESQGIAGSAKQARTYDALGNAPHANDPYSIPEPHPGRNQYVPSGKAFGCVRKSDWTEMNRVIGRGPSTSSCPRLEPVSIAALSGGERIGDRGVDDGRGGTYYRERVHGAVRPRRTQLPIVSQEMPR